MVDFSNGMGVGMGSAAWPQVPNYQGGQIGPFTPGVPSLGVPQSGFPCAFPAATPENRPEVLACTNPMQMGYNRFGENSSTANTVGSDFTAWPNPTGQIN